MKTQKEFHNEMLRNLNNIQDKTPNSFSYDITSSVAIVCQELDRQIENNLLKFDSQNLEGEELDRRCLQESGTIRKQATKSNGAVTVITDKDITVKKGEILLADELEFTVIEETDITNNSGTVYVECKEPGAVGNIIPRAINAFKVSHEGVVSVYNENAFENGYEKEEDMELWERHIEKLLYPPKSGNPAHYKVWATEIDGIGYAKVFPRFQGPLTVRVVLIDMKHKTVDPRLVEKVKKHIDVERPFGVNELSVESAKEKTVNIKVNLKLVNGFIVSDVKENIKNKIEKYLYDIAFKQDFISYAKIGACILNSNGVADYSNLEINDLNKNIELKEDEVAILGQLEVIE